MKTRATLIDIEDLHHQRFFLKVSGGGLEEKFVRIWRRAARVLLALCVLPRKPRTVRWEETFPHSDAASLALAWPFLVAALLDGLERHQNIPIAPGSQESQRGTQRCAAVQGLDYTCRQLWPPPGIRCSDVAASSPRVPVSFLLACFKRPNRGTESPSPFSETLSRPAGSRRQWPAPRRVPAWFGSSHRSRQLALKCLHLKAPVLHSATFLEHFPVTPSKVLSFFFLTSFISSNTPRAAQTCCLTYSRYLEFQSGWLRSQLPGRGCITSLTVLGSHPQLITLILYTL